jgi:hypothetical protein
MNIEWLFMQKQKNKKQKTKILRFVVNNNPSSTLSNYK